MEHSPGFTASPEAQSAIKSIGNRTDVLLRQRLITHRERSPAKQCPGIGDILFVVKIAHRYPNEYKKIYANADISAGEAALSTGIAEAALISAMINMKAYQCDNRKTFPLRYVVDLIAHESFIWWRNSYKYEVKRVINSIGDTKLRSGLLEIFSFYLFSDDGQARVFEDTVHVIAEYLRMHPVDGVVSSAVSINNINNISNEISTEISMDLGGLNQTMQSLQNLIETIIQAKSASNTAAPAAPPVWHRVIQNSINLNHHVDPQEYDLAEDLRKELGLSPPQFVDYLRQHRRELPIPYISFYSNGTHHCSQVFPASATLKHAELGQAMFRWSLQTLDRLDTHIVSKCRASHQVNGIHAEARDK